MWSRYGRAPIARPRPNGSKGSIAENIAIDIIATVAIMQSVAGRHQDIQSLLPLPEATFHILMALTDEDRHGYAIIQDVAARTRGKVTIGAGTLYRSIQRMLEQGLIIETRDRPPPELDDDRRRYYRLTPFGLAVARAELGRLSSLVKLARARGLTAEQA